MTSLIGEIESSKRSFQNEKYTIYTKAQCLYTYVYLHLHSQIESDTPISEIL